MGNLSNVKKGDKVIMRLFTGAFSGVKEVEKADKSFIYFTTGKGTSKFSRKTGKMVEPEPKSERFANYIEEYDPDVEAEELAKKESSRAAKAKRLAKEKAASKKAAKTSKKQEEPEDNEDDDEEEEPAPKKKAVKKVAKKAAPKKVEEDDDEYEELDD